MISKLLEFIKNKQSELVLGIAVTLISIIAFESGKISALRHLKEPLEIKNSLTNTYENSNMSNQSQKNSIRQNKAGTILKNDFHVVASKNSMAYHFSWCSGAKRIKEENKITFSSEQDAKNRGYTLASNCQR